MDGEKPGVGDLKEFVPNFMTMQLKSLNGLWISTGINKEFSEADRLPGSYLGEQGSQMGQVRYAL